MCRTYLYLAKDEEKLLGKNVTNILIIRSVYVSRYQLLLFTLLLYQMYVVCIWLMILFHIVYVCGVYVICVEYLVLRWACACLSILLCLFVVCCVLYSFSHSTFVVVVVFCRNIALAYVCI